MTEWVKQDADGYRWTDARTFARHQDVELLTLPRSVRIILAAALRGAACGSMDIEECKRIAQWHPGIGDHSEWRFPVGRVLMQDASGIPLLADLAAMRDAVAKRGENPARIDLGIPCSLVIDHSIDADKWGNARALSDNMNMEFARNAERYAFVRWAQQAFQGLTVVPPGNGIVHQVHLERLVELVSVRDGWAFCDTVIGTDSHTTMVNGLGVLGWGVGGIEAEAALLGQPVSLRAPEIVSVHLVGAPRAGVHGADLALALTARLRRENVVGAFIEFHGDGVARLSVAERNTIANMAPEYGAMLALFPIDSAVLDYLTTNGRDPKKVAQASNHLERESLHDTDLTRVVFDRRVHFDLAEVVPVLAGPSLPQQLVPLPEVARSFSSAFPGEPKDGRVVLAAITSCTNTANLKSLVAAGLLARAAVMQGLKPPAYVKTIFAPGSRAVVDKLERAELMRPLAELGFHVAAYGCGPCVGNSGTLAPGIEAALEDGSIAVAVLSGNRNFEGRIHRSVRAAYLANPMLVVAYALAGRIDADVASLLARLSVTEDDIRQALAVAEGMQPSREWYQPEAWSVLPDCKGPLFPWRRDSTFLIRPPFFVERAQSRLQPFEGARPLLVLGDSATTDHISPVGAIAKDSAAARYLESLGVPASEFGSYASRRVNHNVMIRGTFANEHLRNRLVNRSGPWTRHFPDNDCLPIQVAAERYARERVATVILAGHHYGAGSARDWAAKGTSLLGIRAVLARSFERIHRSNLVALGVLPIEVRLDHDPWDWAEQRRAVTIAVRFDPAAIAPDGDVNIELTLENERRLLRGVLRVATISELNQLRVGTLFDQSLARALECSDA